MGTLYRWTFDGQPNNVLVSPANSDDFGDPAFATASATATATMVYSTDHPLLGTAGIKVSAAATETVVLRAPSITPTNQYAIQVNGLYLTEAPTAAFALAQWRTSAGNAFAWQLGVDRKLYLLDGASAIKLTMATALPLNTQLLVDAVADITGGVGSSAFKHRAKNLGTNTAIDEQISLVQNLGTSQFVTGQAAKPNSAGAIANMYIDNLAMQDATTDYIVPNSTMLSVALSVVPLSGNAPLNVTATATPTGGIGTPVQYTFSWGDSTTTGPQSSPTAVHTYTTGGDFPVIVSAVNS